MANDLRNLVIVSHVVHYCSGNRLYAYGPYAREIDVWADLFPNVIIAAPLRHESPPADCQTLSRSNVTVLPVREIGRQSLKDKLAQLVYLPSVIVRLCVVMWKADAIHVRCPGNLGLLGVLLAPLFCRRIVAKYAGQWSGYPGEGRTFKLQRDLLRSWWWRGLVTVYGEWPGQPAKVVPFFTSILTANQVSRARESARRKGGEKELRVLFVGRLSTSKNVDTLLDAVSLLKQRGIRISCAVLGDGPERSKLEKRSSELKLGEQVQFAGAVPFERVLEFYEWADTLVLTSETEGWPKAIAEAMAFGLVCVGSNRGFVPQMLAEDRGLVITPRDIPALTSSLYQIATQREKFSPMRRKAAEWAQSYSLEGLREALRDLLSRHWGVPLQVTGRPINPQPEEVRA